MTATVTFQPKRMGKTRQLLHWLTPTYGLTRVANSLAGKKATVVIEKTGLMIDGQKVAHSQHLAGRLYYYGVDRLVLDNVTAYDLKAAFRSILHRSSIEPTARKIARYGIDVEVAGFEAEQKGLMQICRSISENRIPVSWGEFNGTRVWAYADRDELKGLWILLSGLFFSLGTCVYYPFDWQAQGSFFDKAAIGFVVGIVFGGAYFWGVDEVVVRVVDLNRYSRLRELYSQAKAGKILDQQIQQFIKLLNKVASQIGRGELVKRIIASLPARAVNVVAKTLKGRKVESSLLEAIAKHPDTEKSFLIEIAKGETGFTLSNDMGGGERERIAIIAFNNLRERLTPGELTVLGASIYNCIRQQVAIHPQTPRETLVRLINDKNGQIALATGRHLLTVVGGETLDASRCSSVGEIKLELIPRLSTEEIVAILAEWPKDPIATHIEYGEDHYVFGPSEYTVVDEWGYFDSTVDTLIETLKLLPSQETEKIVSLLKGKNQLLHDMIRKRWAA